jgi:hypothetical protein
MLVERVARQTGRRFLGCSRFPSCRFTADIAFPPSPSTVEPNSSVESVQHVEYLTALLTGDRGAVGMALGTLQESAREYPSRRSVRPRTLFLAPLLARSGDPRWPKARDRAHAQLRGNALQYRDRAAERWLLAT